VSRVQWTKVGSVKSRNTRSLRGAPGRNSFANKLFDNMEERGSRVVTVDRA
jgi:hypothetical protein